VTVGNRGDSAAEATFPICTTELLLRIMNHFVRQHPWRNTAIFTLFDGAVGGVCGSGPDSIVYGFGAWISNLHSTSQRRGGSVLSSTSTV